MEKSPAKIIEFKRPSGDAMIELKPRDYRDCEHSGFIVDDKNRTVECGKCGRQLDAMHVLVLLAYSERRQRWVTENREEAAKTIKAAVIGLRNRAITPERYAILYEKYKNEQPEKERGGW